MTVVRNLAFIEEPIVQDNPNLKYVPRAFRGFIARRSTARSQQG